MSLSISFCIHLDRLDLTFFICLTSIDFFHLNLTKINFNYLILLNLSFKNTRELVKLVIKVGRPEEKSKVDISKAQKSGCSKSMVIELGCPNVLYSFFKSADLLSTKIACQFSHYKAHVLKHRPIFSTRCERSILNLGTLNFILSFCRVYFSYVSYSKLWFSLKSAYFKSCPRRRMKMMIT